MHTLTEGEKNGCSYIYISFKTNKTTRQTGNFARIPVFPGTSAVTAVVLAAKTPVTTPGDRAVVGRVLGRPRPLAGATVSRTAVAPLGQHRGSLVGHVAGSRGG
jgi:hypothetical protein